MMVARHIGAMALTAILAGLAWPTAAQDGTWRLAQFQAGPTDQDRERERDRAEDQDRDGARGEEGERDQPPGGGGAQPRAPGATLSGDRPPSGDERS